jgi:hypothetical protein
VKTGLHAQKPNPLIKGGCQMAAKKKAAKKKAAKKRR